MARKLGREQIDLGRLNENERSALRMLAEGHTAKTAAREMDTTPAAINERLREARRKTGIGSSRELARILRAQEKRHEQIGMAAARPSDDAASAMAARFRRPRTGVLAMAGILLVAAAAAAASWMAQSPPETRETDPLVGGTIQTFPQPADQHAKVRSESRDPQWAPAMETQIRERLMQLPLIGKGGNSLRVTCASTMCEIAGTLIPPDEAASSDRNSQYSRTIEQLQVPPLTDDLAQLGLASEGGSFLKGEGKPDRAIFLLYYSRARKQPG